MRGAQRLDQRLVEAGLRARRTAIGGQQPGAPTAEGCSDGKNDPEAIVLFDRALAGPQLMQLVKLAEADEKSSATKTTTPPSRC